MKESLKGIAQLMNRENSPEMDIPAYISELCLTVNSCSIYIDYIGKYEERYQTLFHVVYRESFDI